MKVLIVDDHDEVRNALETRLGAAPAIDVVGCTASWEIGVKQALELEPDVVLFETKRADDEGLHALECFAERCTAAVVVLTSYADPDERDIARSRGAVRYLLKDIDTTRLVGEISSLLP